MQKPRVCLAGSLKFVYDAVRGNFYGRVEYGGSQGVEEPRCKAKGVDV